jgi:hypothetical protein
MSRFFLGAGYPLRYPRRKFEDEKDHDQQGKHAPFRLIMPSRRCIVVIAFFMRAPDRLA